MKTCPLPVDWLDLLEGRSSAADRSHADECPSCEAVVTSLAGSSVVSDSSLAGGVRAIASKADRAAISPPPTFDQVRVGQLWWTREVPTVATRLAILVINIEQADAASDTWIDAVPLWVDDDFGTSSDLSFSPDDSSSGVWWRAVFRHQFVMPKDQLDVPIGTLSPSGIALLDEVAAGRAPASRVGNSIESEYDPRLADDEWIAAAARELAAAFAAATEERTESRVSVKPVESTQPSPIGVLLFLKVSRESVSREESSSYQLAAATGSDARQRVRAVGSDPQTGARVDGWLTLTDSDQLVFEVKEAIGVPMRVRLNVYATTQHEPIITDAELSAGASVVLGTDLGISEFDVQGLEIARR